MFIALTIISSLMFVNENREFFQVSSKQMKEGATWKFVGAQITNPKAKSISIRSWDGDRYIFWKLHK
tara:strand:- start:298 stop:498 length:201 start_codon:yes stop_codon:yes gene_type:complete